MRMSRTLFIATPEPVATTKATFSPPYIVQKSPWHSPLPYLFGGLAAMLGLIAFALLILACSYWRLAGGLSNEENSGERDLEGGGDVKVDDIAAAAKAMPVFEEKIVVIMAGNVKPTFLATPMSNYRASSLEDATKKNDRDDKGKVMADLVDEKPKLQERSDDHDQMNARQSQESPEQNQ